jgi:hypothetical protein
VTAGQAVQSSSHTARPVGFEDRIHDLLLTSVPAGDLPRALFRGSPRAAVCSPVEEESGRVLYLYCDRGVWILSPYRFSREMRKLREGSFVSGRCRRGLAEMGIALPVPLPAARWGAADPQQGRNIRRVSLKRNRYAVCGYSWAGSCPILR